jgi:hypothetical protein
MIQSFLRIGEGIATTHELCLALTVSRAAKIGENPSILSPDNSGGRHRGAPVLARLRRVERHRRSHVSDLLRFQKRDIVTGVPGR